MRLSFPNPSRSFDATRNRVQFWGYDNAIEVSFVVEEDALEKLCPDMSRAEAGFLDAFDAARARIHEVAEKVYVRSKKRSYAFCLAAKDL
jgi:polysaccharide deacetylase 2 family uncharacterized protein YibQ